MEEKIIWSIIDQSKLGPMSLILVLSLVAVSFPAISKQIPVIRIPHVMFFIGKHFGTGVILSTAFCHLLQDSFESLFKSHHKIAKWTGLIILCSLLSIFLIEYISMTCVDYLHASPEITCSHLETRKTFSSDRDRGPIASVPERQFRFASDCSPHPDPDQHKHHDHHTRDTLSLPVALITNSRRRIKCCLSERCTCDTQEEQMQCYDERLARQRRGQNDVPELKSVKRQLIGISVLQLGIMIHSLVIGLTLSIKKGPEFVSLFIAICFHQMFEGLSLGIRIDTLPQLPRVLLSPSASSSQLSVSFEHTPLLPDRQSRESSPWCFNSAWVKMIFSILFAITTPFGMVLGMAIFPRSNNDLHDEQKLFLLTQGVMSAISAGMLIYAGIVEMLAADFVFGDVSGGHHHSSDTQARVSDLEEHAQTELEEGEGDEPTTAEVHHPRHEGHKTSTIKQKVVAVASLLAGVAVMNITAVFE